MFIPIPPKSELEHLYLHKGMSPQKIGDKYGCSGGTVRKWLEKYEIPLRIRIPIPPKSELEHLYLVRRLSTQRIGSEYGCSDSTVRKWLKKYEIPRCVPYGQKGHHLRITKSPSIEDRPVKARYIDTCSILKDHAEDLEDDSERLSTAFLQKLIGTNCDLD